MDERLAELWAQGVTGPQIARMFHMGRGAVMGRLNRLGLLNTGRRNASPSVLQARQEAKAMPQPLLLPTPLGPKCLIGRGAPRPHGFAQHFGRWLPSLS